MMPSMLLFFNISGGELAIIALLIFIVLGPEKMPEIARKFGKAMRFVRKATEDIKREINIDEDLVQKPRSYAYTKKTAPVDKMAESEKTETKAKASTETKANTSVNESENNKSDK